MAACLSGTTSVLTLVTTEMHNLDMSESSLHVTTVAAEALKKWDGCH